VATSRSGLAAFGSSRAARPINDAFEAQSQAVIRKIVLDTCPHTLTTLRGHLLSLKRTQEVGASRSQLAEMFRALHSLTGHAGLAGLNRIAQMSSALEALLQELDDKPKHVNGSSLRTLASGVDALGRLFESSAEPLTDAWPSAVVFVVDDDAICCRAVCAALDKVNLRSISLDDPEVALRVLERNRFDLIFLELDMPKLNGFELATRLRALESNRATPIVFVTDIGSFESRASSILNGSSDLIAKPFLLIELAVKALTYLVKAPSPPSANPSLADNAGMPAT
jgi:CheY-like chemotaxis protein